jgi:hypothetical protein
LITFPAIQASLLAGTQGTLYLWFVALDTGTINDSILAAVLVSYGPAITGLSQTSGRPGEHVTVVGTGFGSTGGTNTVTFNNVPASIVSWADTSITASVPAGTTTGGVVVKVSNVSSSPAPFTVLPCNYSMNPTSVTSPGTASSGTILLTTTAACAWTATSDASWATVVPGTGVGSASIQYAIAASGLTTARTAILTIGGQTVSVSQAAGVILPPVVTSVSPGSGGAGTSVTVVGSNFDNVIGTSTVWLGTRVGTVVSWADGQIVASVSTGATSGTVQVRQHGLVSNTLPFTVLVPTLTSVTPTTGGAGTVVTLNGSGFGGTPGQVWLGTAAGTVTSWAEEQVVATVASGSATGKAQILQNGVWSSAVAFTVTGGRPHLD